jgi:3-methyladenine DNA glycosylase AlkC
LDNAAEVRERIGAAWVKATLGKPVQKVEDNSQILLDLYDNQSKKFARILNPLSM